MTRLLKSVNLQPTSMTVYTIILWHIAENNHNPAILDHIYCNTNIYTDSIVAIEIMYSKVSHLMLVILALIYFNNGEPL